MPWPTRSVAANERTSNTDATGKQAVESIFSKSHTMEFQTSVDLVMNHTPELILLPEWLLRNSPLKLLRDLQRAKDEFKQYMHEVISGSTTSTSTSARGDLLSSMIKASKYDKCNALSEQETVGNIFVFVLAGHETTATTLQTALILLAANPELQQQIQDEINGIWAAKKEGEDLDYGDYPKMRVIMALMVSRVPLS
jgi:cytochrome P450